MTAARGPVIDGTIVIIGGFPQDTPRGTMEQAWGQHLQRSVAENMNVEGMYVEAPFLLSSALQARCTTSSQARILVATIRKLFQGQVVNMYATLQKPKDAEKLQSFLHPSLAAQLPYRCVC